MDDRTVSERVAHAMVSNHLEQQEGRCDLDYLTALAMATRQNEMAHRLYRYNLVGGGLTEVRRAAIAMAIRMNNRKRWHLPQKEVVRIADSALKMYLHPVCPACEGRKYRLQEGSNSLSSRFCHKCTGTGKRNYPRQGEKYIREVVQALIGIVDVTERSIMYRLGIRNVL